MLNRLLDMQRKLDERIVNEKGLEGKDLFQDTVMALLVELGELANEGRWFKYWSDDRKPRTNEDVICNVCKGTGEDSDVYYERFTCRSCGGNGIISSRNPLLEEYVDCLHFFLSIAIQKGWEEALQDQVTKVTEGQLTNEVLEMISSLSKIAVDSKIKHDTIIKLFLLRKSWLYFLSIGIEGFGFTWDQIEQAYIEKNKINHERLDSGY